MEDNHVLSIPEIGEKLIQHLWDNYWSKLYATLKNHPELQKNFTTFLLKPKNVIIYIGKTHWGIEYIGDLNTKGIDLNKITDDFEGKIFDYSESDNLLKDIIGIDYSPQTDITFPILDYTVGLVHPTNEALMLLLDNKWNISGQQMQLAVNGGDFVLQEGHWHRIINSFFYRTDDTGLVTRHVRWLDLLPLQKINIKDSQVYEYNFSFFSEIEKIIDHDVTYEYPLPSGYQEEKWYNLNRFVELISSKNTSEPQITAFLTETQNQFILKLAFMGVQVAAERELKWQSENRTPIRPDFFIKEASGFWNIVEFKLPGLKNMRSVVGRENRFTFSSEINSYISQTRAYEYYFQDPNNRRYVQEKYKIDVQNPKRFLVIGRRWMIDTPEWKEIENDYRNIKIITYDEIIDLVLSHLYL